MYLSFSLLFTKYSVYFKNQIEKKRYLNCEICSPEWLIYSKKDVMQHWYNYVDIDIMHNVTKKSLINSTVNSNKF